MDDRHITEIITHFKRIKRPINDEEESFNNQNKFTFADKHNRINRKAFHKPNILIETQVNPDDETKPIKESPKINTVNSISNHKGLEIYTVSLFTKVNAFIENSAR